MIFKHRMYNNPKLAEELMFGSLDDRVNKINEQLWKKFNGDRAEYYINIVKICGKPITARARYVIAMAYSWNRVVYCKEAIKYLELYLSKTLYKDKCVPNGIYSRKERTNLHLTEMYCYLGSAYRNNKDYDNAIKNYYKAIYYTPTYVPSYLKIAEIYGWQKDFNSAINVLEKAKNSRYAKLRTGNEKLGELFLDKNALDKRINEYKYRLYIETKYPYNQKQVRELTMLELEKQNININLTQPKLKLIYDKFGLKNKKEYFYKYPESDIYICSKELIDILVNSLINNQNLIDDIKKENKK